MLGNTPNQTSKFKTKSWVEINDDACGTYNTNIQIEFKYSMLKSTLCEYRDVYVLVSGTIYVPNTGTAAVWKNRKNMIIKNFAPFTDWISEMNNTQIDNAKDMDEVMPMYNLIEYSNYYFKSSECF